MSLSWPDLDPNEILDFQLDWTARLEDGDTITGSTWVVPTGLTNHSEGNDTTTTTLWLRDGVASATPYTVVNRVTTAGGRTMDQSVSMYVKEK